MSKIRLSGDDAEFLRKFVTDEAELRETALDRSDYIEDGRRAAELVQEPVLQSSELLTPKDIQEGTANHVRLIINACADGDPREAGYLADDLLDQLVTGHLVVTKRVTPLDHQLIERTANAAYERGVRDGQAKAFTQARETLRGEVSKALRGVL